MITVESIYQARRDEQARRLELRIEGIYQDHPQLKEINNQINLKHLDLARAKLFDPSAAEREELELYELKGDRDRYMKDHDIDPASFKMQYDCNLCQDRGYIVTETAHKKCPCLMKIKEGLRHGQSHISGRIEKDNFDNFDINIFMFCFFKWYTNFLNSFICCHKNISQYSYQHPPQPLLQRERFLARFRHGSKRRSCRPRLGA